jgi:hypothetical protein
MRHDGRLPDAEFADAPSVALWGAGELCIKMLDRFTVLHEDRYVVVDSSKSRQGHTVRGKAIHAPEHAIANGASAIIVTVVRRKDEVLEQIESLRWQADIYAPELSRTEPAGLSFGLTRIGMRHD